jgi:PAS domain S-box-containing protein
LFRDLPPRARWYIIAVIAGGAATLVLLLPRAELSPILSLVALAVLSSLTSAFKVQFPIASGSNMSVSYVVDIFALILRGPHPTMIIGAASGWSQTVLGTRERNPAYRTLFNMACLVLTVQAAGQVYQRLGGTPHLTLASTLPLLGMAITYFLVNTVPIAFAIALTTDQHPCVIWKSEFAPTAPNYLLGAGAAAVVIAVMASSGYWLTLLLGTLPLYLTWQVYRAGVESEARQGAILEAAADAIISADANLKIREFNPAAERMFGWPRLGILGKSLDMLTPASIRSAQMAALQRYHATGGGPLADGPLETIAVRADGTEFPVELSVSRVGEGNRARLTGFVRDITERRALEEQLRQSQKLEAVGRLASGVAHDFNNILMSIVGSADLMLMQLPEHEPARAEAKEIKVSVQRGAGLTRQLLAFSRRQATSPRLVALEDVVSGMEVMLRRLIGTQVELEIHRGPQPTRVLADPAQIEQVVLNLVINARDAMPEGGRLTLNMESVEGDDSDAMAHVEGRRGWFARMTISDTGTGIDEATRARLFEPFFTTKEEGKGSGLGLSIVYGIVKQNGGYVGVVSERGQGATFHIYLPLAGAPSPAESGPAPRSPTGPRTESSTS